MRVMGRAAVVSTPNNSLIRETIRANVGEPTTGDSYQLVAQEALDRVLELAAESAFLKECEKANYQAPTKPENDRYAKEALF